jgi:hypothetical protein
LLAGGVDAGTQRVVRQGSATTSGRAGLQID